jgi:AcrR family transcriptional regulator
MSREASLRERKKRRAREAIVDAAYALFAERGFAEVTVAEIAERAEVGRTTFFRYFGDKQEVLFAEEQHLIDELRRQGSEAPATAPTFLEALDQVRGAVNVACDLVTADAQRYRLHEELVAGNPELHDRSERKLLHLTEAMTTTLRAQGLAAREAMLAAHIGLACFRAGKATADLDPAALKPAVDAAFDALLQHVRQP